MEESDPLQRRTSRLTKCPGRFYRDSLPCPWITPPRPRKFIRVCPESRVRKTPEKQVLIMECEVWTNEIHLPLCRIGTPYLHGICEIVWWMHSVGIQHGTYWMNGRTRVPQAMSLIRRYSWKWNNLKLEWNNWRKPELYEWLHWSSPRFLCCFASCSLEFKFQAPLFLFSVFLRIRRTMPELRFECLRSVDRYCGVCVVDVFTYTINTILTCLRSLSILTPC